MIHPIMDALLAHFKENFPYLTEAQISTIMEMGELRQLAPAEAFIKQGEFTMRCAFVLSGCLRNYVTNEDGTEITVVFAMAFQQIGAYACYFLGRPSNETTEAIEDSLVLVLDLAVLKDKLQHDPLLARAYIQLLEKSFTAAIQRIEDFTQTSPEDRYVRLLQSQPHLLERIPLKYIASYLGMTFTSLSRIRGRIARKR